MTATYDVGDTAPLTLTVDPAGDDTDVQAVAIDPDGAERPLVAVPDADRTTWTARLPLDSPGLWTTRWTVTGTGAGSERHEVAVRPDPDDAGGARVYATTADLARWLGDVPPASSRRMLAAASRAVDAALVGAVYRTDDTGRPTHPVTRAALRDATCAAVTSWGDPDDAAGGWTDVSIGSVRLGGRKAASSTATTDQGNATLPTDAMDALQRAGLLPIVPTVIG